MQRKISAIFPKKATLEGAGVKLHRVFGSYEVPNFDPFLLLDHFGSRNPDDYIKGFPWHPHRGIETVTYMLAGEIDHGDSLGNKGAIRSGDIQWMTAGSGIIHQEMPKRYEGMMEGFQLWVNLPAASKMMEPRYREIIKSQVPMVQDENALIRVIAGEYNDTFGPVKDLVIDISYFDITLKSEEPLQIPTPIDYNTFIYIFEGSVAVDGNLIESGNCVLLTDGEMAVFSSDDNARFLFLSGARIEEPVAWGGPIVMNTEEELRQAFRELDEGAFIRGAAGLGTNAGFYQG